MSKRLFLLPFLAASPLAAAQDGQQLFTLYCSACHGTDGKGATGGTFPPLAGSPWPNGDPGRAVKIALKGLTGPVDVLGKTYNLEMPPQGATLPDDQIAAILTYVRSSWGNASPAISTDLVKSTRAAIDDRKMPWTAAEILKLHPLPLEKTALTNLTSQTFSGEWKTLPDFTKLTAENIEEEHDGIITLKDSTHEDLFGMVWQGGFEAPADGSYEFILDADDAAAVTIDGKKVAVVDGIGPMDGSRAKTGKIDLTAGSHPFRVDYVEYTGQQGIALGWRGPGGKDIHWLTEDTVGKSNSRKAIPIVPVNGRPVIYRNFIAGTTPRAIGVGFPGGVNLAWSADDLAPELIWTGDFIDGSAKWVERGTDNSPPAGENVVHLTSSRNLPTEARFRGYKLDSAGNPSFSVQIGDQILLESFHAETGKLVRKLSLSGNGSPVAIPVTDHAPDNLTITADGAPLAGGSVNLAPGKPITLEYHWK